MIKNIRGVRWCLAALTIFGMGGNAHGAECGDPSPSVASGEAYYNELQGSRLTQAQWERLRSMVAGIKAEWRGKGSIWLCGVDTQPHSSELKLEIEGSLEQKLRFRKRMTDVREGTIELQRFFLNKAGDLIEFNSQAHLALVELDPRSFEFRARFKIRAHGGNIINREIVRSLHLEGDALIYEEREFTQGLLSWQGRWTLERII